MNRLILLFCTVFIALAAQAQLEVKEDLTSQIDNAFQTEPRSDGNQKPCALIIVKIPLDNVEFDGNVVGKTVRKKDGYWVYVTSGTKRIEILPGNNYNSLYYEFPEDIKQQGGVQGTNTYTLIIEPPIRVPKSNFTLSAGFNAVGVLGPTASVGFMFHNFTVEAGATIGLSKSKDVYIYDKGGDLLDAYNYKALRGHLRFGYDIWMAPIFAITPQVGAAFISLSGSRIGDVPVPSEKTLNGATAISATLGTRLMFAPSGRTKAFRLYITPEYDLAVQKDKNYEALSAFDSKMKSWAEGLSLSLGLMFYF